MALLPIPPCFKKQSRFPMSLRSLTGGGPKHSFWVGPWRYCGICYWKCHIKDMTRQRGVLRCPSCTERSNDGFPLVGQREVAIDAVLTDGKQELVPVEKLRDPDAFQEAEDFIL